MVIIKKSMLAIEQIKVLKKELTYKTARSGGKGGQNVNKVETKVELYFDVLGSKGLSEFQKHRILEKLKNKISEDGVLKLSEDNSRSQLANKVLVQERFFEMLNKALKISKPRKATKPSKASKAKRVDNKKKRGDIKQSRRKLF